MAELRDVVAYLCQKYPHKQELSKGRLAKMVFLAELRAVRERGERITEVEWEYRRRGPYLRDGDVLPSSDPCFRVLEGTSVFGEVMEVVAVAGDVDYPSLTPDDARILEQVVKEAATREWEELCEHVCGTIPVACRPTARDVDLAALSPEHREKGR